MKDWRKRRKNGVVLALLLMIGLVAGTAPKIASAHPLGNFTVNRYSRLEIGAAGVNLYYILDIAEIPTLQEKTQIDTNGDGQISDSERQAYLDRQAAQLQTGLQLKLGNQPANLKLVEKDLTFLTGQGGLQTTRLTMHLQTATLNSDLTSLSYTDTNYSDRLGWKEIVVRNTDGVALQNSSVSSQDQSDELRNYPQDMLTSPLNLTSAQATFRLDPTVHVAQSGQSGGNVVRSNDPFAALITGQELTLGFILFAFGAAFVLGMAHAFSPGHGKTVVGAYLVGSRGTAKHALFLGLTVTITHTIGVFTLGLITLFASQFILPEKLYPWLSLASGVLVLVMGLLLLRSRWRSARLASAAHNDHDHEHTHHEHNHDHEHAHTSVLEPALALATAQTGQNSATIALAAPTTHHHADHDHPHEHDHDHEHNDDPEHGHDHGTGWHTHGPGTKAHSHLPPGADGTPLTWKRLLLFGISAGLLPCPSALIVMLSAISLNRTAFGLVLIVFFSLGLAATLTGIGLGLLYARDWLARRKLSATGRLVRWVPLVGALAVTVIGVAVTWDGLVQIGLLSR